MTKNFKTFFLPPLLLMFFTLGFFSGRPDCFGLLSQRRFQENVKIAAAGAITAPCTGNLCNSVPFPVSGPYGGVCCKEKRCDGEGSLDFGNQGSKTPKDSSDVVAVGPGPLSVDKKISPLLSRYIDSQATPIYILTQTFLC